MRTFYKSFLLFILLIVCSINSSFAQWVKIGQIPATALIITTTASGDTVLYAGSTNGLNYSTDGGTSWNPKYYFGSASPGSVNTFAVSDTNIIAGTNSGIYLSTNNCKSWSVPDSDLLTRNITSVVFSGKNIFAGIWPTSKIINTPPYSEAIPGGVILSTNNGATWNVVDSGMTDSTTTIVSAFASIGNTIIAGTDDGSGIFRSTNNGTSWTPVNNGLFTDFGDSTLYVRENAFAVIGANVFAGTEQGVFRSTDNGVSWSQASTGIQLNDFSQFPSISCLAAAGTNLFAGVTGGSPGGIYFSTNSGSSWTWIDSGKVGFYLASIVVSGNYVYAVSESGVWRRLLSDFSITGVATLNEEVPQTFSLEQNFPNPFNPTTTIEFTVPEEGQATLRVYNMLGQEVATLFNGVAKAGEYHQTIFNAQNFASGIYLVRLESNGNRAMKKMLLVK